MGGPRELLTIAMVVMIVTAFLPAPFARAARWAAPRPPPASGEDEPAEPPPDQDPR